MYKNLYDKYNAKVNKLKKQIGGGKNIGFDFDGVFHIDVTPHDQNGHRHPFDHYEPNPKKFDKIHNLIKNKYENGNTIYIITARDNKSKNLIRNYLNNHGMQFVDDDKILCNGSKPKSETIREYEIAEFYDDSQINIDDIMKNKYKLDKLEKLFFVNPDDESIKQIA